MPCVLVSLDKLKDPHSGLGQFSADLGLALAQAGAPDISLTYLVPRSRRNVLDGAGVPLVDVTPFGKESVRRLIRPFLPGTVRRRGAPDLWHAAHQDAKYLPMDPTIPVVLTVHDLNMLRERKPAVFLRKLDALQRKVDRAVAVSTVSRFSAGEIAEHLDLAGKPLRVIHNGLAMVVPEPARPQWLPDGDFMFTIGHVVARKNVSVLVPLMSRLPGHRLVVAGRNTGSYAAEVAAAMEREGLGDRVIMSGEVTGPERRWLYQNCTALLFPSITEGFGLPVLEAMREGKPVFMSRTTSLPEVGGELGFYWDSFDPDHMAGVVESGLAVAQSDPRFADRLREHAAGFSWEKAALGYLELYRAVTG